MEKIDEFKVGFKVKALSGVDNEWHQGKIIQILE